MKEWIFKVYINTSGDNVIDNWLNEIPVKAKAKIRIIITYLEIQKVWKKLYFAKYKGSENIYEIRAISNNVQYRIFGCFGPNESEFTLLIGAVKKGKKLNPIDAIKTAEQRHKLIFKDERYLDEYY